MPNDAKLGLVVGVALVIVVAVIFFRKELPGQVNVPGPSATIVQPVAMPAPASTTTRNVPARFIARTEQEEKE